MNKPGNHKTYKSASALVLGGVLAAATLVFFFNRPGAEEPPSSTSTAPPAASDHQQATAAQPQPDAPQRFTAAARQAAPRAADTGASGQLVKRYLAEADPTARLSAGKAIIARHAATQPAEASQILGYILHRDLWGVEVMRPDGVIDQIVTPQSLRLAMDAFFELEAVAPAPAAEQLENTPSEITSKIINEWAIRQEPENTDHLQAFLSGLNPDNAKAASWRLAEAWYENQGHAAALHGLAPLQDFLPMPADSVLSVIAQRPPRQ